MMPGQRHVAATLSKAAYAADFAKIHGARSLAMLVYRKVLWARTVSKVRRLTFLSRALSFPDAREDESPYVREALAQSKALTEELLTQNRGRLGDRSDLRFFIHLPPGGASRFFLEDIASCMRHAGLAVLTWTPDLGDCMAAVREARPSVFISLDSPEMLSVLPLPSLLDYKERYGLLRLFIASPSFDVFGDVVLRAPDQRRLDLCRNGMTSDAFISYFEPAYWELFCKPWHDTRRPFFSIPFGCNPFRHYAVDVERNMDWGIATANMDLGVRAVLTLRYMRHVMPRYRGDLAGSHWGPGIEPVPSGQISEFFCRARIAPNFAAQINIDHPIDCGEKVHQLAAMGVFQIATTMGALRKYYAEDEVVTCSDPREFEDKFAHFVVRPAERHAHTLKAMTTALRENSYFERVDRLVANVDALLARTSANGVTSTH